MKWQNLQAMSIYSLIISFIISIVSTTGNAQVLPAGNYRIVLADGGKALDADAPDINGNGCKIHLWDYNGGASQVWSIKPVAGNAYSIVLAASGKALDADGPGMYKNGGRIQLWEKRIDGFKTQTWKINSAGNNSYTIILEASGKALDAGISSMYQNDGLIHLWDNNGGKTQKWIITPIVQLNDAQTIISSLSPLSPADNALWEKASNDQLGIIGNDFRGPEYIGTASFERNIQATTWWAKVLDGISLGQLEQLDNLNFWVPQQREKGPFKRTLSGKISALPGGELNPHMANEPEIYPDFDLCIFIDPLPNYNYLLSEAKGKEYTKLMSAEYWGTAHKFGKPDCNSESDKQDFSQRLEAEIDAHVNVKNLMINLIGQVPGKNICVYGPWIYDKGHCCHPEIHPAEQIWWKENTAGGIKYNCNVFCDASERFWWRDQMDDGSKPKPWGAPPIKGLFALAFEVRLGQETGYKQSLKRFEASYIDHYNLIEYPGADKTYNLVYQNKTIVSFMPHNSAFKVSYEKVGLKPGTTNVIRGFLILETSVGTCTQIATEIQTTVNGSTFRLPFPIGSNPNAVPQQYERQLFKKVKGHYMFSILETTSGGKTFNPKETDNRKGRQ